MKRTRTLTMLLGVLALAVLTSGCATYKTHGSVPMMGRQKNEVVMVKNGIETSILPIKNKEDSLPYFDEDLPGEGIFSAYVVMRNMTSETATISGLDLKINGQKDAIEASDSSLPYEAAKRAYAFRAFLLMYPTFGIGGPASLVHTKNINDEMKKDYKDKSLIESDKEIKPFGTCQGFVWFKMPGKDMPKGAEIGISLVKPKGEKVRYGISVPD